MGTLVPVTVIRVPPGGRAEFIMTGPSMTVKTARLMTLAIGTGADGDNDPGRPLILITPNPTAPTPAMARSPYQPPAPRSDINSGSRDSRIGHAEYFPASYISPENNPLSQFFITVQGATPTLFSVANGPAIITKQGSVEDWVIQNQTLENHEFHIHQIHFLLMSKNGVPVSAANQQMLDTIDIPHWDGAGPYPSAGSYPAGFPAAPTSGISCTTVIFWSMRTVA